MTATVPLNHIQREQSLGYQWPAWHATLANYRNPNLRKSSWQLANILLPYGCLWALMIWTIRSGYPFAATMALAMVAAAFLVRVFILFHDCVHDLLFRGKSANTFFGYLLGGLVFTPFDD